MKKKDTELDELEKKDVDESKEKKEKPGESEKKSFDIRSIKLLTFLAIVFLSFIIVIILIWLLLSEKKTTPKSQKEVEKTATIDKAKKGEITPDLILYSFDTFFVPLVGSSKERNFLKIGLDVELSSTMLKKEIKTNLPEIRSSIFKIITSKTITDIQDKKGKKRLKSEIIAKLNSLVRSGKIKEIYFSQFIIQ